MSLRDRFRFAIAGVGRTLGGRRPGVELVRVDQPELLAAPVPRSLPALPAPTYPVCEACGDRHPRPLRHPRGLAAYRKVIDPWTTDRPQPLGQSPAHDRALYRDQVSAWRYGTLDPPGGTDPYLDELREELHAPRTYWWDQ